MLEEYLGHCAPQSAYFDVISLNSPASDAGDGGDPVLELVDTLPSMAPDPELACERQQLVTMVREFVEALPHHLKQAATAHFWDELSQSEIARNLHISQSAVSQRLSKVIALGRHHFGVVAH